jgi:tetratricopeptide (TPR) repeat protein
MTSKQALKIAEKYYFGMKYEQAVQILQEFYITMKPTLRIDLFLCRCYDQWALITTDLSKKREFQENGIKICNNLLPIYPKSVSLFLNLGNIYHHMALDNPGYNKKAILNYKKALVLAKNKSQKTNCLNSVANSYQRMGDLNKALIYYSRGNSLSKEKNIAILYNLSFIYLKLQEWSKCLEVSHKYLKLTLKLPNSKMQVMFRMTIKNNILQARIARDKQISNALYLS